MNLPTETIQPYLFYEGRCEEAVEYYRQHLGAQVLMMMRFKDSPEAPPPGCGPTDPNKIMHVAMRIGTSTVLAADGSCQKAAEFKGFAISYTAATEPEADKVFAALSNGGQIMMPLMKTFFSPRFGMTTDKFGVLWMVYMAPKA